MPFLSRRWFCVSVGFAPIVLAPRAVLAYCSAPPTEDAVDLSVETLVAQGTRMMREGRTFEKAALRFAQAAQKEPTNAAHQTGLGCALASRAVYIAYAAAFTRFLTQERAEYPKAVREWEAGRDDWEKVKAETPEDYRYKNRTYDESKPKLPPARDFVTKDDQSPFRLTNEQTAARLTELCAQARKAWETSIPLSKTPDEKAEALYVQAWGLRILRDYLSGWGTDQPFALGLESEDAEDGDTKTRRKPTPLPLVPTQDDVLRAVKEAVSLAPENAQYAQALGDLLWDTDKPKAIASYEKAISLAPKNPNLLYRLYQDAIEKDLRAFNETPKPTEQKGASPVEPGKPVEPFAVSLHYLRQAQSRDRANAWPLYEEAAIYFRLAPYSIVGPSGNPDASAVEKQAALDAVENNAARRNGKKAVDLIVSGNPLPQYALPMYEETVPKLLRQAWDVNIIRLMMRTGFESFARLRELARSTTGYAQVMIGHENNAGEAVRANRAAIGMGLRVVGDWATDDDIRKGKTVIESLVGAAMCAIGYKGLIQTYTTAGDKQGAEAAQKESDAFQSRVTAYKKDVSARASMLASGGFPYSAY